MERRWDAAGEPSEEKAVFIPLSIKSPASKMPPGF